MNNYGLFSTFNGAELTGLRSLNLTFTGPETAIEKRVEISEDAAGTGFGNLILTRSRSAATRQMAAELGPQAGVSSSLNHYPTSQQLAPISITLFAIVRILRKSSRVLMSLGRTPAESSPSREKAKPFIGVSNNKPQTFEDPLFDLFLILPLQSVQFGHLIEKTRCHVGRRMCYMLQDPLNI